jgi:Flp pilus assembly protein TadD
MPQIGRPRMLSESLESRLEAALSAMQMIRKHRDLLHSILSDVIRVSCPTTDERIGFMLHISATLLAEAKQALKNENQT